MRIMLPRRTVLSAATAGCAAVAAGIRPRLAAAVRRNAPPTTVFLLSPIYPDTGLPCGGCHACRACIRHAANKIFATPEAADAGRAHPNCDCAIIAIRVGAGTWMALFGSPVNPRTLSRDRRERNASRFPAVPLP